MVNKLGVKEIITLFSTAYREVYGVNYSPNWGRDSRLISTKLVGIFSDEDIRAIVEISGKEYDSRWARPRYPRPTIGAICSWLANEAIAIKQAQDKADRLITERERVDINQYLDKL